MKKTFTFYDLSFKKRLFGLLFILLLSNISFAQTFCRPDSQTNSTGGLLCVGMNVSNPDNAFDGDMGTFASISNVLGLVCFAQETLHFNQTAKAGDQIVVYFNTGNGVLNAELLSNGTIQAKNGVANVGPAVALSNGILNLQILDPVNNIGVIKYTLPGDANSVKIQSGGLLSVLLSLRIYEVRLQFAKPTIVGGNTQSVCSGQSIALTATAAAGTTLAWYDSPTSTTVLSNTNTFTTPSLTVAKTYYVSSSRNAGCESDERVPVTINITTPVLPTIDTSGTAVCSAGTMQSTTLSVISPVPGTIYSWYDTASAGKLLGAGNTFTTTVPTGVTNFYVEAAIGTCKTPTRTPVSVTSTPVPKDPTVLTQSVSILSGQNATLSASSSDPSVTFDWYDAATGGTKLLANSATYTTPILTANKTYYVETVSATGGCVSTTRVAINVTVSTNPLGGCLDANSQQTNKNGLCLFCSSSDSNNSVDGISSTAARLSVPVGLLNGWIQQTLQFNNPGQAGDVVTVDLELPTGLLDVSALSYITLATYNGATYNNDRIAVNSSLLNVQLIAGNRFIANITAGSAFDRVEIRLGGLAMVLTSLDIYGASYKFKARTISGNTTICSGQTTTLTSSASLGETINWYDSLTGGTLLSSTAAYTTPALTANTTYYVEVTRNGCVNSVRFPVLVTVNNPVAPATVVASPVNLCSGQTSTITVQSPVAGTNYNWYSAASGGTSLFTGTSFTTPSLTTTTSYYVEAEIGSCLSPTRTQVTVNVSARPTVPTVTSSNVAIQAGQSVTLQVSNPVAGIDYDWYDAPVNGNLLASATTSYTPTPNLTVNKSFYITARSTATDCISDTRAVINVSISNSINSCLLANSQITSKGGTTNCLSCGSSNEGGSVDGNNTTAAHLSIPLGLLGDFMQQVLSFPTAGEAGDIIDVELGIPVGLLDISALSNISLQSFNSGLPNADQSNISSLLNVQLLGGNRFRASFVAAGPFTSVQIKMTGLALVLASLDIYEASYRYPDATITDATAPICTGQSTTLKATAAGTQTFSWYDVPTGGTALATNTSTYTTGVLTGTKTFYLEASRGVTPCLNTNRLAITVTVLPIPTDADIAITTPLTATCAGGVVLSPTSTLAGATFKYYTDQTKTQEIVSGTLAGVTYLKDATTGALTISGLIASNSPYKYYVSVLNAGSCENINGTLKEVVVNYPAGSALTVTTTLAGCAKVNLKDAITNFDTSGNTTYTFFDAANTPITDQAAANITIDGDYWIQAQTTGVACPSVKEKVTVTINPLPTLVVTTASQVVNKGISVPLVATSNGTVTWYDPAGNPIPSNNTGVLNTVGVFTYTVIASNGTCTNSQTITISVIDPASCDPLLEREYATTQKWGSIITGTVTNEANGADGNPKTYSTITTGLGLLGIGTTWQNLQWPTTIAKGTPVTVKLGSEYSAVAVGQSVTVVGTKRDGLGNPIDIGTLKLVSASLLNLLSGQNSFEYTFVPSDISGPKAYDGIRVQLGSILSVAQSINVYDAYYDKPVTQITCGQGDIEDVFSGVKEIGVGALTATVGVSNAWNIADDDVATYATMFSGVGVLAAAQLTATFRTPSMVGDSLRITISKPGTVLNLNLLTGFSIQLYSGNIAVGVPIQNTSSLLTLKLLSGDTMAMTIVAPQTQPYDRVTISFGGVASVLDQLRVHTIDRVTNTKVIGGDKDNMLTVCPGTDIKLEVAPQNCSTYKWYDSPTGGKELASGQTYTLPATLAAGTYHFYIQPIRYGCPALERGEVKVVVRATTPASAIASIEINGSPNPIICATDGKVTLKAVLSAAPVLTNPVYHWYSFDGTTSNLIAGETTSTLIRQLVPGTYTFSVGVSSDEYCESVSGDRKQVTFIILPNSLSTDISVDNSSICHDTDATLTPTSTLSNPLFYWYFDVNKTQPIISSVTPVNGVTYTISNTGVLTTSGLTAAMNPISYYVAVSSDNTCQNKEGELKMVTVTVSNPATPTTDDNTQEFCLLSNPTIADLQVNEGNVIWYDSLASTTALLPTTPLTSKIYYGAISIPIQLNPTTLCESAVRLAVTVTVNDPGTPVITKTVQDFCLVNAPTLANIDVSPAIAANIVWYDALTGGNLIAAGTKLTNTTYYAAIKDPTTLCESNVRLAITVNVTDPGTPVITKTVQDFCLVNASTLANIDVSPAVAANIVWYDALTGGNLIAAGTKLTNRIYYAALKDATTTCESNVRLAVTVNVSDPGTPTTTDATQDFCLVNKPTVANLQVNEADVFWYTTSAGGTALASTTALVNGVIYYGGFVNTATNCDSAVRLEVAVSVTDPGTPTTGDTTQDFCLVNAPTVANIQVDAPTTGTIVWYTALTGGTVIPSTTALTNGSYYAAIKDPTTTCESNVRLAITVKVTDPGTPIITKTTQDFCLVNAPTLANIDVSPAIAANIVWYDALTGGNLIATGTKLTSRIYYVALKDATTTCESSVRLAVTVNVTDPGTPTTADATQDFCLVDASTVASIQVDIPTTGTIIWYTALTGGTVIAPTTVLTTGSYFATIRNTTTNCESAVRLEVAVSVTDPGTPVITKTTQDFCLVNAATLANIDVSPAIATNIVWYDALTGGNLIATGTKLANTTYYAAIKDPITLCESNVRLAITVNVTDPGTPIITKTTQDFCLVNAPTLANIDVSPAVATNIVWYDALTGGNLVGAGTKLTNRIYYAAIKDATTTCESDVRLAVTVNVTDPGTPTTADATQDFCLVDAPKVADIQVDTPATGTIIWYNALTGGTAIAPATVLTTGSYFAAIHNATTNCESTVRLEVAVSITDPGTPTTGDTTQDFCLVNTPTVANIQVDVTTTGTIVWYTALTGGTVIPSATALTNGSYFASIHNSTTNCESLVRLEVVVSVTDPVTPTTTATTQVFCSGNNPTVASIQVNEANVVWYNAITGGTALNPTIALVSGDYFGAIKDLTTGCESTIRLKVTVTVGNTINPTTNNATQNFCSTVAPTVASIQVNESNVVWYTASTGGTVIPATTALTSGVYFGNIIDPLTACESSTRLQVTVIVSDPSATPTTDSVTQDFCSVNNPKVSDIQVNEANVVWYSTSTGGTVIPATTALVTGSYFGVVSNTAGCENPVRLEVKVNVNTPGVITTPRTAQTFCLTALPTIANILVNETNVVWYSSATGGTALAVNTPLTATTYYAGALNNTTNGCDSATRLGVTISFENDALVQLTSTDDTPCVFQEVTYSIANGKSNYVWSITNGTIVFGGGNADGSVTVSWSDIGPGKVEVTYTNNCDETTTKSLNVTVATCSDLTITKTVSNPTPNFGDDVTFTITVNNVGEGNFINTLVSELLPSGYDLVSSTVTAGTYDPATQVWTIPTLKAGESVMLTVTATVLHNGNYVNVATIEISTPLDVDVNNNSASASVDPICLVVYNEFTPNNDGANDLFRIDCIETYPNNELKVFNRYGALVYSQKHYENDWNGTANVSGVINRGDMLPTGTYFYVIDIGDGTVKKGWLSIMR